RDRNVTGVQTCALPICIFGLAGGLLGGQLLLFGFQLGQQFLVLFVGGDVPILDPLHQLGRGGGLGRRIQQGRAGGFQHRLFLGRSEERRVGRGRSAQST